MLSDKKILLGVTGGIAAYKAVELLRLYQKAGAEVRVTMTASATRFVGSETFAALSRNPVAINVFSDQADPDEWVRHIHWSEWADIFVIAPCTANTLAKIVHGLTDNMLTSMVSAARCPIVLCPTMDGEMFFSPAVKRNLEIAREDGFHILEPEEGYLASGMENKGRLPEPEQILEYTSGIITRSEILSGKKVLVSAGPTREFIDPVRFISNPSSGKMGLAVAKAAQRMGAEVTLLLGPVSLQVPPGIHVKRYTSTDDLFQLVQTCFPDHDVLAMSSAVSDFKPKDRSNQKIKKDKGGDTIKLDRTPDILEWSGTHRSEHQTIIGFAMETDNLEEHARSKLTRKNVDWIAANELIEGKSGFAVDHNEIVLLSKDGSSHKFNGTKDAVAEAMLNEIFGE